MNLISIPALVDNYIWLLHNDDSQCLVVDPGEAAPVLQALAERHLIPIAILLTHHHHDHVGGVFELLRHFPVPVYGPEETHAKGATRIVNEGDTLTLLDHTFSIMALPGHTLGHIGFYGAPWLFSGDTIFSAGCGRLFEGTPKQMYESFHKVNQLPPDTLICAAHEYTSRNLDFATALLPQDSVITDYQREIKELRLKNQPSLPTTLHLERQINLFLRYHHIDLQKKLNVHPYSGEEWLIFAALREKKDHF
ncbi:hydroxyacylglutathione hydrolase [Sodalis-like endosymbiont of Proechinophthirus fluctus]|uniref:hydroxyacylglutathione hydrolase n=1 Tax=Sodalis-like endosymbiont of Proechinophthirus fluctus TaxID=1462730 RepID=UPI0007A8B4B8|nr:hydroxyacylglutathione hydrolase [Sodalis-like endosymbiont of Proechinophthirus fluctus]KYP97370.1 hydroxyacylglutathione hydrolase [Sodalis-like endosymbiont of Proechinophthirus fluctus]